MEQQRLRIAVVLAIAMMIFPFNCLATEYTVGDTALWALGVNYTAWASGKTFAVGDKLFFTYTSSQHDVLVVNKAAYDSCTATSPLNSYTTGNDTITLSATGTQYYICGVTGHCSGGMKLAITVAAASTSKSNGSVPSPSPAPTRPSAAPTPTTAKSPSPSPSSTAPTPTTSKTPSPSSTTPTPSSSQSPPVPSSANTPAAAASPPTTTGANSPTGSNKSAAAPSYQVGGFLVLGGTLLFGMALL